MKKDSKPKKITSGKQVILILLLKFKWFTLERKK